MRKSDSLFASSCINLEMSYDISTSIIVCHEITALQLYVHAVSRGHITGILTPMISIFTSAIDVIGISHNTAVFGFSRTSLQLYAAAPVEIQCH